MAHTHEHTRVALSAECAVFGSDEGDLEGRPLQREMKPVAFVPVEPSAENAARRELAEETGTSLAGSKESPASERSCGRQRLGVLKKFTDREVGRRDPVVGYRRSSAWRQPPGI